MATIDKTYQWQGREDAEESQNGLRWHQVMNNQHQPIVAVCLVLNVT